VIDTHSMYQSQWKKRLTYYKKCCYQIERWSMGASSGTSFKAPAAAAAKPTGCLLED